MPQIITNSEKQTFDLARKYAQKLKGGEIIGLVGDLGAGKTVFAKGLAQGLGMQKTITSPTFVLMKVYPAKNPSIKTLVHIDAYRLKNARELDTIGAEEYFNRSDTVVVIEWADKIKKTLPRKTRILKIVSGKNNKRKIFCE